MTAVGRNAARAAVSARRGYLTAAGLSTLMTGLDEVAEIQLPIASTCRDEYEQIRAFASGAATEPGEALVAAAAKYRTTVAELTRRCRDQAGPEFDTEFHHVLAVHCGYLVTARSLRGRHAYFCTDEMAAVVQSAAQTALQPDTSFTECDLPSPDGVAYLSGPENPIILRWCSLGQTVTVTRTSLGDVVRLLEGGTKVDLKLHVPQPFEHIVLSEERCDESPTIEVHRAFLKDHAASGSENPAATLIAFSRLIQQERTTDVTKEPVQSRLVDRRGRKRTQLDQITYVSIRRANRSETTEGGPGRSYSHRWVVRGHWRRQWYPSQDRHIPIWITDHVAGPEDKPIVRRDKITMVRQSPPEHKE